MNGPRQTSLLAKASPEGVIIPRGNAEHCAARRLARRGVVHRYRFGGPVLGYLTIYKVVTP